MCRGGGVADGFGGERREEEGRAVGPKAIGEVCKMGRVGTSAGTSMFLRPFAAACVE